MERNASQRYLRQQVLSASPAGLVAMLLDRAVALLNEVVEAIAAGKVEGRWRANAKATEIICHLWETLDMERGGEIAARLANPTCSLRNETRSGHSDRWARPCTERQCAARGRG